MSLYQAGDHAGAVDAFLTFVLDPDYRQILGKFLPSGAFERAVADCDTPYRVELGALQEWSFSAEDAARISQPVLSVIGDRSGSIFEERHKQLQQWIPHAEELRIPEAHHALQYMNPGAVASGLARFLDRHPL